MVRLTWLITECAVENHAPDGFPCLMKDGLIFGPCFVEYCIRKIPGYLVNPCIRIVFLLHKCCD